MEVGEKIKIFPDTDVAAYRRLIRELGFTSAAHKDYIEVKAIKKTNKYDAKKLGALIKRKRKVKNLTRKQLAEAIPVHYYTLGYWEAGTRRPYDYNLEILIDKLNIKKEELEACKQ